MSDTMTTPRKQPGRPKQPVPKAAFQVRLSGELNAALEKARRVARRAKNEEVIIALEEYLQRLGYWPISEQEGQS